MIHNLCDLMTLPLSCYVEQSVPKKCPGQIWYDNDNLIKKLKPMKKM